MIHVSTLKVILFFVDMRLLQAAILDNKDVAYMFYLIVDRFLARVQSPTCTTYGKCIRQSIMAPKSGIMNNSGWSYFR